MKDAQRLVDRPEQSTADRIAEVLKETEERPLWQLRMVVKCLGSDKALELLTETEQIEQQGGMLVPDGSRRRTPGGVFFALARKKLPKGDRLRIFGLPGGRPQKPRATAEAAPASETRPLVAVSPRTRRRLVEVSTIAQYRAPGPFRPGVKSPPPHPLPHAKPSEEPMAGGELPDVGVQRVPAEPQEPPQARPRRIVTIADLKGHQQQSSEPSTAASEATGAPSALTGTRWSEDGRSEEAGSPRPATPDELREYVVGLLERHPATSRQRLLLDLLLEDLGEAPVAPGRVPLPIRLTVIMAHRLGYSVEATAQQVFGDGSQKARRSVEEILAKGVDFELLERLFELAERA